MSSLTSCPKCFGYGSPFNSKSTKPCKPCSGTGLIKSSPPALHHDDDRNRKNVIIVGSGIAGPSLYLALRHRGISSVILDKDTSKSSRSQGYGLTLQQGMRAMRFLGFEEVQGSCYSDRHVVMDVGGEVKGEWGRRKWKGRETGKHNVHISRIGLRDMVLGGIREEDVRWNCGVVKVEETGEGCRVETEGGEVFEGNFVVGCDGIRSRTREYLIEDGLNFLGTYVILGILKRPENEITDGKTVFQVSDGSTRFYSMPFDSESYMWQLSFILDGEEEGREIKEQDLKELAKEKCSGWKWAEPMLASTPSSNITGYNVYDRDVVPDFGGSDTRKVTCIGDAAHPMSPFKGQGANQAVIDAVGLGRAIKKFYHDVEKGRVERNNSGIMLKEFEREMMQRAGGKVMKSREAAEFLHSPLVLEEGDVTRGGVFNATKKAKTEE
ncbi:hypothetical protein TrVE_jg5663 [Triparma verrucosa]|uniref:FAD-binding domain-containing protein n=1 Tax=Triparma verrucosa TaxID=1606542 RepID=A0A9W6ZCL9_9STRA|nr:hypothetical protein TrVE_jg5663 [Triparma verrucosa]